MECNELLPSPSQSVCQDALSDGKSNCPPTQDLKIGEYQINVESMIDEYLNNTHEAPSDPCVTSILDELGEYLTERYKSTMDISYLEKSIKLARQAIEATPINDEHWLKRMRALSFSFRKEFLTSIRRNAQTIA